MRIEVNTSGSWKVIGEVPDDRLDLVRDLCEIVAAMDAGGRSISFRLTQLMPDGKTRYRAESMVKRPGRTLE